MGRRILAAIRKAVDLGDRQVETRVLKVRRGPEAEGEAREVTYWIDDSENLILKSVERHAREDPFGGVLEHITTTLVQELDLNASLPDSHLVFTPPEGAREVDEFVFCPASGTRINVRFQKSHTRTAKPQESVGPRHPALWARLKSRCRSNAL